MKKLSNYTGEVFSTETGEPLMRVFAATFFLASEQPDSERVVLDGGQMFVPATDSLQISESETFN